MSTPSCPSRTLLAAYQTGELTETVAEGVTSHVSTCPACQVELETIRDQEDPFVSQLRVARFEEPFLNEPGLATAVAEARATVGRLFPPGPLEDASLPETTRVRKIGEYELLEKLGEGGMGTVYKARQMHLGRLMALKVLPASRSCDQTAISRFYREMRAVGRLRHPNIVEAFDAREIDGAPVLAMEYIVGIDLSKLVSQLGALPIPDACELVRQTALGLQHAHEHGLVHRDIKPSNLLLSETGTVKILDLGLALLDSAGPAGTETTGAGTAMGTPDYISPEQVSDSHRVDIRSDIYSLGCTLYKLVTGQAPFAGPGFRNGVAKMMAHVQTTPPPLGQYRPDLPENLEQVVQRMMAKQPEDRFATPREVVAALTPFTSGCNLPGLLATASNAQPPVAAEAECSAHADPMNASAEVNTDAVAATEAAAPAVAPAASTAPASRSQPRADVASGVRHRKPWILAAVALGLVGALWGGVVLLRVKTPVGTIVIEADQLEIGGAVVEVDGERQVTIDPGRGQERVTVRADDKEHVLKVTKGGFETYTKRFTVRAGDTQTLSVHLEPLASDVASTPPPAPKAAAKSPAIATSAKTPEPISAPPPTSQKPVAIPPLFAVEGREDLPIGPQLTALPGLVPRPSRLPGISRWQIVTRAPSRNVTSVAWSKSGLLAVTSGWYDVRIFDGETLKPKAYICPSGISSSAFGGAGRVAWNPDGTHLAMAGRGLWVWNVDGRLERKLESERLFGGSAWSPDGKRIATADPSGVVVVSLDGSPPQVFRGHESGVHALAWSPDGKRLASAGGSDRTVRVWTLDGSEEPRIFLHTARTEGGVSQPQDVAWSPDGRSIATTDLDWCMRIWSLDGAVRIVGQADQCVEWLPNGQKLVEAGGSFEGYARIVTSDGTKRRVLPGVTAPVADIAVRSDGKRIACGDACGNVYVWDEAGRKIASLPGTFYPLCVAWSPQGLLATRSGDLQRNRDGVVAFWDEAGRIVRTGRHDPAYGSFAWSPDGEYLVSAGYEGNRRMRMWNSDGSRAWWIDAPGLTAEWATTGRQLHTWSGTGNELCDYDPQGKQVGSIRTGDAAPMTGPRWSCDGRWIVAWGAERKIRLWTADGTPGPQIDMSPGDGWNATNGSYCWHPTELLLAVVRPHWIRVYRVASPAALAGRSETEVSPATEPVVKTDGPSTLELVWQRDCFVDGTGSMTAWGPDGQWLAVEGCTERGNELRVWHVSGRSGPSLVIDASGQLVIESLAWSPDSRRLAVGTLQKRLSVWDVQTGDAVWSGIYLPGGKSAVFSSAGQLLVGQDDLPLLDEQLAYLIERADGSWEPVEPSRFPARVAELARQASPPPWSADAMMAADGTVDLLARVATRAEADPDQEWTRDGSVLVAPRRAAPDQAAKLLLPVNLSGDYDLAITAETPGSVEELAFLLQADDHPCEAVFCRNGNVSGVQAVDGQPVESNASCVREPLVDGGQKFRLVCEVRRGQIRMVVNDRAVMDWKGDFATLSAGDFWGTDAQDGLLGLRVLGVYRIHELKLVPRSETAKRTLNGGDRAVAEELLAYGFPVNIRQSGQESQVAWPGALPAGFFRICVVCLDHARDPDVRACRPLLEQLPRLRGVAIRYSLVTDQGVKHLDGLPGIRELTLHSPSLANPLAAVPSFHTSVQGLKIEATLDAESLRPLARMTALRDLQLVNSQLDDATLLQLPKLPALPKLDLNDNPLQLGEAAVEHLAGFPALTVLNLMKVPAPEENLLRLSRLRQLEHLDLSGTQATDRVLDELQKLVNLKSVNLYGVPATEPAAKRLQAALPGCAVFWTAATPKTP